MNETIMYNQLIKIILGKRLGLQATIPNINNLHTVKWFQVFLSNINISI